MCIYIYICVYVRTYYRQSTAMATDTKKKKVSVKTHPTYPKMITRTVASKSASPRAAMKRTEEKIPHTKVISTRVNGNSVSRLTITLLIDVPVGAEA